ncbi:MAG: hypothetical protein Q9200_002571 [Gallowayella weberi]
MKLSTLLLTITQATIALSSAPAGRPTPNDNERDTLKTTDPTTDKLVARDCWFGASYGCSKGYCWKSCGTRGQWCWLATNNGAGPWFKCSNDQMCAPGITTRGFISYRPSSSPSDYCVDGTGINSELMGWDGGFLTRKGVKV